MPIGRYRMSRRTRNERGKTRERHIKFFLSEELHQKLTLMANDTTVDNLTKPLGTSDFMRNLIEAAWERRGKLRPDGTLPASLLAERVREHAERKQAAGE